MTKEILITGNVKQKVKEEHIFLKIIPEQHHVKNNKIIQGVILARMH